MKNDTINLYLPGLWALLRHAGSEMQADMPSLQLLLNRCDSLTDNTLESEAHLLGRLGWQTDDETDVPVAALEGLAQGASDQRDSFWFRADPVNLQEDQNYLMMSYPSEMNLDLEEAESLAYSVNQHFAEDGWSIVVADARRWYLKLDKPADIQTTAAWRAVGKDVFNLMPVGNNSRQWHSWLMELQMLFYSHPVNEARGAQGLTAVSGLWLWGGGELPLLSQGCQHLLWGDSCFMQGVSRQSGCEIKALPEDMSTVLNEIPLKGEQLMMLEQARTALLSGSLDQGVSVLKQLEKQVFKPLVNLLKSGKLKRLTVIDTPGFVLDASASGMKKWWRRRKFIPA
uniref:Signal peptide protein n=1 Tax=uncultured bacterium ws633F6 TaxID=1131832 RepID=I1X4Y7_9BACT|nr:signal peptide protein [uncultured bacterium ws633F6]